MNIFDRSERSGTRFKDKLHSKSAILRDILTRRPIYFPSSKLEATYSNLVAPGTTAFQFETVSRTEYLYNARSTS